MGLGERDDLGQLFQFNADAQGMGDMVLLHEAEYLGQFACQVREIDMAVRVDIHAVKKLTHRPLSTIHN